MWTVVGYKVLYLSIILAVSLIFTPLPRAINVNERILSIGNCFSGGIFIAIGMNHLLRESAETLGNLLGDHIPWAYILSCVGILFTFLVEKVLFNHTHELTPESVRICREYQKLIATSSEFPSISNSGHSSSGHSPRKGGTVSPGKGWPSGTSGGLTPRDLLTDLFSDVERGQATRSDFSPDRLKDALVGFSEVPFGNSENPTRASLSPLDIDHLRLHNSEIDSREAVREVQQTLRPPGDLVTGGLAQGDLEASPMPGSPENAFLPMILTLVLSIHSMIAGLTMGIHQQPEIITAIFIAIITHKWIESLALGINMKKNRLAWNKSFALIIIYSFMVPLGIGLGSFLDIWLQGRVLDITTGVCLAISSGTFLYVAFIDVLPEEFKTSEGKYPKFLALIVGVTLATACILAFDYDH